MTVHVPRTLEEILEGTEEMSDDEDFQYYGEDFDEHLHYLDGETYMWNGWF